MLYDCWREIALQFSHEMALRDWASGESWTFSQLAAVAEKMEAAPGRVVFPRRSGAEFIFSVLCAWRNGQVVCPLEPGFNSLDSLEVHSPPGGAVHLKLTSATTGVPRVVVFTREQLAADANNIVETMGLRPDSANLGAISLAHSYGFSNLVLPLLLHGVPLILAGSQLPEAIRKSGRDMGKLTLPAVPALWRAWHDAGAIPPDIRLAISAGAPLPLELEQSVFERAGVKIHNFYGATECGGIAYDATERPRADAMCVGSALRRVQLDLNPEGCLQVRSGAVGLSYWPDGDVRLENGCFQTSDLAHFSGGQVYLRGRLSDQINVAGRKVSPELIERAILAHSAVRDCLVFGIPSEKNSRGEIIVGCVIWRDSTRLSELKDWLRTALPGWQIPREWWVLEELPVNVRGKVSRAALRKRYLALGGMTGPMKFE